MREWSRLACNLKLPFLGQHLEPGGVMLESRVMAQLAYSYIFRIPSLIRSDIWLVNDSALYESCTFGIYSF